MRRWKSEKLMAWLCILDILAGMLLLSGIFEGSMNWTPLLMFTVLNALWALLYYLLELRYLKIKGRGVISSAMHMTILVNATGMAVVSMIYLGPMHSNLVGPDHAALILLQYVLPALMLVDYLIGLKNTFRKKHILYAMIFPMAYNAVALIMGAAGYGFGMDGAKYPYPFLNAEQLGWGIVSANVGMLIVVMYLYCRLWIFIDRLGKRND